MKGMFGPGLNLDAAWSMIWKYLSGWFAARHRQLMSANDTTAIDLTGLLGAWQEPETRDRVLSLVYPELKRIAEGRMRKERGDHTLEPTALVNEVFLRLVDQKRINFHNRAHFLALASELMRRILVDHARAHRAGKRGGGAAKVELENAVPVMDPHGFDFFEIHRLLEELAVGNPRGSRVVELRYFGGLTHDEVAEVLGVDARTVKRDWEVARAWLFLRLKDKPAP